MNVPTVHLFAIQLEHAWTLMEATGASVMKDIQVMEQYAQVSQIL